MHTQILQHKLPIIILEHSNMRQILQVFRIEIRIEQIEPILIINLHIADRDLVVSLRIVLYSLKDVPDCSRN